MIWLLVAILGFCVINFLLLAWVLIGLGILQEQIAQVSACRYSDGAERAILDAARTLPNEIVSRLTTPYRGRNDF